MKKAKNSRDYRETILVVDDEPSVLVLIRAMLVGEQYRVLVANEAETAIRLVEQEHWGIDLALIDVCMPNMNGIELANRLLESRPDLRILFMSGFVDDEVIRVNVLDQGLGFMPKPFHASGLLERLRTALEAPRGVPDGTPESASAGQP